MAHHGEHPIPAAAMDDRLGLSGPDKVVPPPEPGPGTPTCPNGGGEAATPPKSDHEILLDEGFSEQEIADMSPRVRAKRLEEAKPTTSESDVPEKNSDIEQ